MAIANYTTDVAVGKTMGDINVALARRGVTRISTNYDDNGNPSGLSFTMKTEYGVRDFELPVRVAGVRKALVADGVPPRYQTTEHAAKVAWRIAHDWLRAQGALIDAGLAELDEVFMPYMVGGHTPDLRPITMYEHFRETQMKEIGR